MHPGILITWSLADVDVGVQASIIQFYPILLSTLLSINRQQLSLFDASFALQLTSSPLTTYLVVASICDLCGFETNLYKRIKYNCIIIRALAILVPFFWLGLSMTLTLSDSAFIDSGLCRGSTFRDWLLHLLRFIWVSVQFGFVPPLSWSFAILFVLFLVRRRSQLVADIRAYRGGASKPWKWLCIPWAFAKCAWCVSVIVGHRFTESHSPSRFVVDRNHKWYTYSLFAYLDITWAYLVITSTVFATLEGYVLSYGQVWLPLCAVDDRIPTEYPPV